MYGTRKKSKGKSSCAEDTRELLKLALEEKPNAFQEVFDEIMLAKIVDISDEMKDEIAQSMFGESHDQDRTDEALNHWDEHVAPKLHKGGNINPQFTKAVDRHVKLYGPHQVWNHHGHDGWENSGYPDWFDAEKKECKPLKRAWVPIDEQLELRWVPIDEEREHTLKKESFEPEEDEVDEDEDFDISDEDLEDLDLDDEDFEDEEISEMKKHENEKGDEKHPRKYSKKGKS
jgi:hypothetical protein